MKISSKNLFARYYRWIYGDLPKDICSFFWGTLYAISLSILHVPGRLILGGSYDRHSLFGQWFLGLVSWALYGVCIALGIAINAKFGYEFVNLFATLTLGFLFGVITIALAIGLILGVIYLLGFTGKSVVNTVINASLTQNTSDFIGAIRKKHCTKIDWE